MPIYEYYCPDNHRIYQFFAKTLAQGQRVPKCPDNPAHRMVKVMSAFAVQRKNAGATPEGAEMPAGPDAAGAEGEDPRMDAAMSAMEREFSSVDENDPRAMGRMMRRMAELTGEKIDGEMEEVVRKLEEGADPDSLEEQFGGGEGEGGGDDPYGESPGPMGASAGQPDPAAESATARTRRLLRRRPAFRDPKLYDYD